MAVNFASKYSEALDQKFLSLSKVSPSTSPTKHLSGWLPIMYTPMCWFYFFNYLLLALMMTLIGCAVYAVATYA